jgi:hypothetical protein
MDTIYYYPFNPYNIEDSIENHPDILESIYDLEKVKPPHKDYNSLMNRCPAMNVYDDLTYIVRSPFDFDLEYTNGEWKSSSSELANSLLIYPSDNKPYIQIAIFYLFWTEKKSDAQIWQHDIPLFLLEKSPTWYSTSGMLPVGRYTRNTSIGLVLRENQHKITIKKNQPLCSLTFVSNKGIRLVKQKPSKKAIQQNIKNNQKKFICPYKFSKELFSRWYK